MYSISFTKSADRTLRTLPREMARRLRERLGQIAENPCAQHSNVTKLRNRPGYRLRVGDWRVIYEIENEELVILVLRIGPRGGVYR